MVSVWHFWLPPTGVLPHGRARQRLVRGGLRTDSELQCPARQYSAARARLEHCAENRCVTSFYRDANTQPGIVYGMYANHIVQRYVDLYGANILRWDQATLRSFQSAISISGQLRRRLVCCLPVSDDLPRRP